MVDTVQKSGLVVMPPPGGSGMDPSTIISKSQGGTGTATPGSVSSSTVAVAGTWPNESFNLSAIPRRLNVNGNFDIWQRGAGPFSSNTYIADGWAMSKGSGTSAVSRVTVSPGVGYGSTKPKYMLRLNQTVAGTNCYISQTIRELQASDNKTLYVSFCAVSASGTVPVGVLLRQYFGPSGSASVDLSQSVNVTTTPQRFTIAFACASISGKVITTGEALGLYLAMPNAISDVTFSEVQVSTHDVPFIEWDKQHELNVCRGQMYRLPFSNANGPICSGFWATATLFRSIIHFPPLRNLPSFGMSAAADFAVLIPGSSVVATGVAMNTTTISSALLDFTVASGGTAGQGGLVLWSTGATAASYLEFIGG